jgi:hypothetical protein
LSLSKGPQHVRSKSVSAWTSDYHDVCDDDAFWHDDALWHDNALWYDVRDDAYHDLTVCDDDAGRLHHSEWDDHGDDGQWNHDDAHNDDTLWNNDALRNDRSDIVDSYIDCSCYDDAGRNNHNCCWNDHDDCCRNNDPCCYDDWIGNNDDSGCHEHGCHDHCGNNDVALGNDDVVWRLHEFGNDWDDRLHDKRPHASAAESQRDPGAAVGVHVSDASL